MTGEPGTLRPVFEKRNFPSRHLIDTLKRLRKRRLIFFRRAMWRFAGLRYCFPRDGSGLTLYRIRNSCGSWLSDPTETGTSLHLNWRNCQIGKIKSPAYCRAHVFSAKIHQKGCLIPLCQVLRLLDWRAFRDPFSGGGPRLVFTLFIFVRGFPPICRHQISSISRWR